MDFNQKKADNIRILWILTFFIVLVGFFFAFAGFSEFFNVAIADESRRSAYPWGSTNESPWYYQTPNIYSIYNLISGTLFFTATILTLWAIKQKKKTIALLGASSIILFVLTELISSSIQ